MAARIFRAMALAVFRRLIGSFSANSATLMAGRQRSQPIAANHVADIFDRGLAWVHPDTLRARGSALAAPEQDVHEELLT